MEPILIGLAGDVMIGRSMEPVINEKGFAYPWGNMLPVLKSTDLNIVNLETTLTRSMDMVDKFFNFKASPNKVETLKLARVKAVNLANNHILDFDTEGLNETISTLDAAGIEHVGAGSNEAESIRPAILDCKGLKIGLTGCTDNEPSWKAGPEKPGTNYLDIANKQECTLMLDTIKQLKSTSDIVIVSIHWGYNMVTRPSALFTGFAHEMINAGADIIHGHSAHIFQAIEVYAKKLILYDTGDFVDDYRVDPDLRNDLGFFYQVEITNGTLRKLQLTPICISNYQVNKAVDDDYIWCMDRIRHLSEEFSTSISPEGILLIPESKRTMDSIDSSIKN